jgi:hypothetical protein
MVEYSCSDMPFQILFYPYLFKFPLTFGRSYFISVPVCLFLHWCYLMQECLSSSNLILSNTDKLTILVHIQGISAVFFLNVRDIQVWSGYGSLFHGKLSEGTTFWIFLYVEPKTTISQYTNADKFLPWMNWFLATSTFLLWTNRRIFFDQWNYIFDKHISFQGMC